MQSKSVLALAEHAAGSLPDSISERKRLLRAITHVLTDNHFAYQQAQAQLASIEAVERLNDQLRLKFHKAHDGHQHNGGDGDGQHKGGKA